MNDLLTFRIDGQAWPECIPCRGTVAEPVAAAFLAAQSSDRGAHVSWVCICEGHAAGWNDGGDWPAPVIAFGTRTKPDDDSLRVCIDDMQEIADNDELSDEDKMTQLRGILFGKLLAHALGASAETMPELKRCPFCGSGNVSFLRGDEPNWNYGGHVECGNCGARGVPCYSDEGAKEQLLEKNHALAADHWNSRAGGEAS